MHIGVPKEIKNNECRVGLSPQSVFELHKSGHTLFIESQAGIGSGFSNQDYLEAGAVVLGTAEDVFKQSELIVKVKEPQLSEIKYLTPKHTLFTYLHLAPDPNQTEALLKSGATCIAYETVTNSAGQLPLLTPMSEIAGRMSVLMGAHYLHKAEGGAGILVSGVPGVNPATIVIIGAGVVGSNALSIAVGLGARSIVLDKNIDTLRVLEQRYGNKIQTLYASKQHLAESLTIADIVIGAVLIPGSAAPKLVKHDDLLIMRTGSVIVDVAVDQGGCFETTRATSHDAPIYEQEGIIHYCVANMPGAFPKTATEALNNATLPFTLELANKGIYSALLSNHHLRNGLQITKGSLCNQAVADAQNIGFISLDEALAQLAKC